MTNQVKIFSDHLADTLPHDAEPSACVVPPVRTDMGSGQDGRGGRLIFNSCRVQSPHVFCLFILSRQSFAHNLGFMLRFIVEHTCQDVEQSMRSAALRRIHDIVLRLRHGVSFAYHISSELIVS